MLNHSKSFRIHLRFLQYFFASQTLRNRQLLDNFNVILSADFRNRLKWNRDCCCLHHCHNWHKPKMKQMSHEQVFVTACHMSHNILVSNRSQMIGDTGYGIWFVSQCDGWHYLNILWSFFDLHVWFLSPAEMHLEVNKVIFYFRIDIKSKGSLNSRIFAENQEPDWSPRKINFKKSARTFRLKKFTARYMCRPSRWKSVLSRTRLELPAAKCRLLMWCAL